MWYLRMNGYFSKKKSLSSDRPLWICPCVLFYWNMNSRSNDNISETTIFQKKTFGQMNFRSNDIPVKWTFGQMIIFRNSFRSNEFSVKWPCVQYFFGQMTFFVESRFGQMTIFWKKSVIWPFGKMNFRSNGIRLNVDSVEWTFGQMAFGQTVLGRMVFRSNGLSVKKFRWNDFSVKWFYGMDHFTENHPNLQILRVLRVKFCFLCSL
jgi:hypothetical protein